MHSALAVAATVQPARRRRHTVADLVAVRLVAVPRLDPVVGVGSIAVGVAIAPVAGRRLASANGVVCTWNAMITVMQSSFQDQTD